MSKPKHTPGPWIFSGQDGPKGFCHAAQIWDSKGNNLAIIDDTESPEEATANARLASSAPDMLEALTQTNIDLRIMKTNIMIAGATHHKWDGYVDKVQEWIDRNDSAIKKALEK